MGEWRRSLPRGLLKIDAAAADAMIARATTLRAEMIDRARTSAEAEEHRLGEGRGVAAWSVTKRARTASHPVLARSRPDQLSEEPGFLRGVGPIDADTARELTCAVDTID